MTNLLGPGIETVDNNLTRSNSSLFSLTNFDKKQILSQFNLVSETIFITIIRDQFKDFLLVQFEQILRRPDFLKN